MSPSDGQRAADSESFEEWLDQAADSKGVSKQELMNQMLSSYWILDELTGLVGETEARQEFGHRSPGPAEADSTDEAPVDADADNADADAADADNADADADQTPDTSDPDAFSTEESIRDIQSAIRELVDAQTPTERQPSGSAFGPIPEFDGGVVAVVSDLQRQVGRFDSELEELEGRQETQFDRLSNELQLVLDRVGGLEANQDSFAHEQELRSLADDLHALNEQLDALRTADAELESRMDREFDSIEELFRRLLGALDELESDVESDLKSTTESLRNDLKPLQERNEAHKQLEALKHEALRNEVRRGVCDSCNQGVDLALLESPTCPSCSDRFTGIDDSGWNPFRSPTLKTARPADPFAESDDNTQ